MPTRSNASRKPVVHGKSCKRVLQIVVLMLIAATSVTAAGCSSSYARGVREWAQPTRELLADRIEAAEAAQRDVLESLVKIESSQTQGDRRDSAVEKAGLENFRFAQSIQMIRDVVAKSQAESRSAADQYRPVLALVGRFSEVHRMFETSLTHAARPASANANPYTTAQMKSAAASTRKEADRLIHALND